MSSRPRPSVPRPFQPRVLKGLWHLREFDLSPDGGRIAVSLNTGGNFAIHLFPLGGGRSRRLTPPEEPSLAPVWSPDGTLIAFQSDSGGDENFDIFTTPAAGGGARNLTQHPDDDAWPQWSPDGRWIAFLSNRDGDRENLFVMGSEGGEARQLTRSREPLTEYAWRPDGSAIAYGAGVSNNTWIGLVDVASGRDRKLLASPNAEYYLAQGITHPPRPWSPDGRSLAFTSNEKDTADIGLLYVGRDKVSWPVVDGNEKFAPTWSPDGQHLAFLRLEEGNLRLYAVRPGGKTVPLSPEKGTVASFAWSPGGEALLYTYSRADDPGALFVTTLRGRWRAVVRSARPGLPRMDLVPPCHVHYPSHDRRIPALLYLPQRRNGAGIVIPHGGPEASQLNEWYPEVQLFASRGYVVIAPNYRGSTGYGRGFRKLSDRDLGGGDLRDVVNAARHLAAEGLASPDRIGIWGHSYGGFMALHALTQAPEVWRVGVSAMGFFNWKTAIEAERGYLQVYDRQKMGNPGDDPEFFRSRSPYFHLNNLRAPLLMFAGRQDPRCPVTEARQVRDKLQALGRRVEYVEYVDEGHWPRKLDNEVDLLQRSLDFVLEHLPPEA